MRHSLFTLVVIAAVATTFAQPVPKDDRPNRDVKPAWQWTESERLAARFDPAATATRINIDQARLASPPDGRRAEVHAERVQVRRPMDVIRGADHPELFLPHEVFRKFMEVAFGAEDPLAVSIREAKNASVRAHGLPDTFWTTVRGEASGYIAALQAEADARRNAHSLEDWQRLIAAQEISCHEESIAFQRLHQLFGEENFNRFLYESIAPDMTFTWFSMPSAVALQREAAGCK
jgi:hypothetical protein